MRSLLITPLILVAAPALADEAQPVDFVEAESASSSEDEILVVATRMRGQIESAQPPVMTLDESDISSYGASSISELIDAVSPQTGSGRGRGEGRPVMLVNGQRISSFRELRSIPPEAIRRMEVLPEEVALRFGYPPNQRVINFILKENFSSVSAAGEYNVPTRGDFTNTEIEGGLVRIGGPRRLNIEAKAVDDSLLTEAERHITQPASSTPTVAGDPDPAQYRSLIDDSRELTLNGTWSSGLGKDGMDGSVSLNGAFTQSDSRALLGLDTVRLVAPDGESAIRSLDDPMERRRRTRTTQAGVTFNKPVGSWQLSATLDGSYIDTRTRIDREVDTDTLVEAAAAGLLPVTGMLPALPDAGLDRTRSKDLALASLVTLNGTPFRLPAGDATLTLRGGFDYDHSRNQDTRGTGDSTRLKRGDASAGFNIGLPITSRREGVLDAIGDVSLNFSAGINHLSDFGTLTDWNAGLTWNPTEKLGFQASYIVNEAAPSLSDLGAPELAVANVPVFDFTRGESVLATVITGGNPDLLKEKQRDLKFSANWELPFLDRSNLIVEYFRNRSDNVTRAFPLLTPAIEAIYPDRVIRDETGRLVQIDRTPVTFDRESGSRLRWGLNLSGPLGKKQPVREGGPGKPGSASGGGRAPMPMMGGPGGGRGRWNISAYHTWRFDEKVRIAAGGPVLDLLHGDAVTAGGVARHSLELEGGVFHKGTGLRLNGSWMAPVTVHSSGAPGASDLRFGSVLNLNARLFFNVGQQEKLVAKHPILKGLRIALTADNILDSRQKVTDPTGFTPLSYQKAYRDPRGRVLGIDVRYMF